ncbi:MAG TPA: PRC-barrel domain-containing protein [Sphingomicrobium sp.]|nr:PRC-barrel domain-containing protein [Sphingomicrobium sp.]
MAAGTKAGGQMGGAGAGGPAATVGTDVSIGSSISTRGNGGGMGAGAGATGSASASGKAGGGSAIDIRGSTSARGKSGASVGTAANVGTLNVELSDVTTGMMVVDSGGATVGTVSAINTIGGSGKLRSVQVTLTDGSIILLSPDSLTVDGDVLATTSLETNVRAANRRVNSQGPANASEQGLANASPNSVLAQAGVTTLIGLTAGLTVNTTGGALVGTVQEVVLNQNGAVVGIRVDLDSNGTVFIPATSLSMDGTTVITTFVPGG